MFGTSRNCKFYGVGRRYLYGIAYEVSPQSVGRRYDEGIVSADFDFPRREYTRIFSIELVQRNEFEEYAQIEHEQHILFLWLVLYAEQSFRSIVSLDIVHAGRRNQFFVVPAIRFKTDTSVKENFEIGPYFA